MKMATPSKKGIPTTSKQGEIQSQPNKEEKSPATQVPTEKEGEQISDTTKPYAVEDGNVEGTKPPPSEIARDNQKLNCCQRCSGSVMKILAHDALYGSFIGPHSVSFICLCYPCRRFFSKSCIRPVSVSSISTKIMYFIMLGFVTLLACFFIIPWPKTVISFESTSIAAFYPCQNKLMRNRELNGGCTAHAGYFMAYRCFFAFGHLMLTNCFIMLGISSSKDSPHRAKIHRGFWFYKYLYLGALLTLYFLFLDGHHDPDGVFEFTCSIIGNIANMLLSFIELTFALDVVELWVVENRASTSKWRDFFYWMCTGVFVVLDLILFGVIVKNFAHRQTFDNQKDIKWPLDNCIEGKRSNVDPLHIGLIFGSVIVIVIMIVVMSYKKVFKKRFPYTGWLQVAIVALFNFLYLWSALYNSSHIHSRPRCNFAISVLIPPYSNQTINGSIDVSKNLQEGSQDIYFRLTGLFHGILAILALLYFTFIHGPLSETAPLSIAYYAFINNNARVPVFPDENDSPKEFLDAVEKYDVWDDEDGEVVYSWSLFYLMMMLGGFSLMMSMTNFTNPWAADMYNSSMVALGCKYGTAILGTLAYILVLLCPCAKVNPESELHQQRKKRRKIIEVKNEAVENVTTPDELGVKDAEEVKQSPSADNNKDAAVAIV